VGNFQFKYFCLKTLALLISMLLFSIVHAQVVREPLSVKYAGLGAYSKNFSDVFSATSNIATLAQLRDASAGVYAERRFMLSEMNGFAGVAAVPSTSGTFGLQADYFGTAEFNESQLGLIYARRVTNQIDVGVKFNYHSVAIRGYGSSAAVNFEAGSIFHLTEKLHTGIHVYNPTGSKLGKSGNEKLASIFRFGLGYEVSKTVFVSTEIVKQEDRQVGVNAGLQYNLHEKVLLRGGISTYTNNSYVGLGLNLGFGRIDINSAFHPQLGFTPGFLLLVNLKKSEKE
jgi:hypothetical protein